MNNENEAPFNPRPMPPELSLAAPQQTVQQRGEAPGAETTTRSSRTEATAKRHKSKGPLTETTGLAETKWNHIKGKLAAQLAKVDQRNPRKVLLASGLVMILTAAVLVMLKLVPIGLMVLAVLGLVLSLKLWDRLFSKPKR